VESLEWEHAAPPIFQIPLTRDGCVETDVDVARAIEVVTAVAPAVNAGD